MPAHLSTLTDDVGTSKHCDTWSHNWAVWRYAISWHFNTWCWHIWVLIYVILPWQPSRWGA